MCAVIRTLSPIPGIDVRAAENILAETGIDMSRWPTDRHITSWAKICPGNNESAGKRRSGWTGNGNPWLRTTLIEAAWSASRKADSYFGALYRRLATRRGKSAIVAVARALLVAIYHMLKRHPVQGARARAFRPHRSRGCGSTQRPAPGEAWLPGHRRAVSGVSRNFQRKDHDGFRGWRQGRPQPTLSYRADVPAPRAGTSAKPSDDRQRSSDEPMLHRDDPAVAEGARNGSWPS